MDGERNKTKPVFADFHTHILPFVDDGAQSVETAAAMLCEERRLADRLFGRTAECFVVFTPHFKSYTMTVDEFLRKRSEGFAALWDYLQNDAPAEVQETASRVNWAMGAEIMVHSDIDKVEGLDKLFIGNSKYLMFEFSEEFFSSSYVQAIERICFKHKASPVIAHFDRYTDFIKENDYRALLRLKNVVFQFNAQDMCSRGGGFITKRLPSDSAKRVLKYAREDVRMIMGSDCHGIRQRKPDCNVGYNSFKQFARPDEYEKFLDFTDKVISEIKG